MRSLFDTVGRHGLELVMGPDRFREFLVIVFTGVGEHPAAMVHTLVAWAAALLVAEKVYPKK